MLKASADGGLTRLEKLKKKIVWKGIGIYVHVIVDKGNIRFYAGQSWELKKWVIDQHGIQATGDPIPHSTTGL